MAILSALSCCKTTYFCVGTFHPELQSLSSMAGGKGVCKLNPIVTVTVLLYIMKHPRPQISQPWGRYNEAVLSSENLYISIFQLVTFTKYIPGYMATVTPLRTDPLVTNTPVPARGTELGPLSIQKPSVSSITRVGSVCVLELFGV